MNGTTGCRLLALGNALRRLTRRPASLQRGSAVCPLFGVLHAQLGPLLGPAQKSRNGTSPMTRNGQSPAGSVPQGCAEDRVPRAAPLPPSLGRHRTPPQSITPPTAACGDEGTRPGRKRNLVYGVDCRHGCRFLSDPSPAAGASHMASRTRTGSRGQDLAAGASGEVTSRERSDHEREGRGPRAG